MNTRYYFYSGKGGVGKTTMASSRAVHFASNGKRTLIVTTDPASNLADVFCQQIGPTITPIASVANLSALELDPDRATADYRERTLAPLRGLIPAESFTVLEEQLSSPCTAEMAAFDRFTDFLQDPAFDVVIFDTAPTGHTLRLLELPVAWSGVIERAAKDGNGQTCIGPAAALADSKEKFDRAIAAMRDTQRTTFIFVVRPEATPLYEARRSIAELQTLHISAVELIVNGLYPKDACDSPFMLQRYAKQQKFLGALKEEFSIPVTLMELEAGEVRGIDGLAAIGRKLAEQPLLLSAYEPEQLQVADVMPPHDPPEISPEILQLLTPQSEHRRTVFFAGKGGVGKTSIASVTALWLADQGYKTLLLTTDPASHLGQLFEQEVTGAPQPVIGETRLWIARIDAAAASEEYKERILAEARQKYDADRVMAIAEELDSPCTEEMAIFETFIAFATNADFEIIVFDTAPTGHTLRLLELPIEWSKQLAIQTFATIGETEGEKATKSRFAATIRMMQDPEQSTFSFVMYPEGTPIAEAARAMEELATINVPTSLIVANLILPESIVTNDYFRQRKAMQDRYLMEMEERFTAPIVTMPLMPDDLIGKEKLRAAGKLLYGIRTEPVPPSPHL